jgi:hypothetical protein
MRQIHVCISVLILLLSTCVAHGASFNPEKAKDHGAWSSLKLTLGAQRFYRAINIDDYSDMRVMIDFDPEKCEPELEIQLDFTRSFSETESLGLRSIALRVDRKPIHESLLELSTVSGDSTVYGYVLVGDFPRLISEMRLGRMFRFKIEMPDENDEPMYAELSLSGSRAALDRASALCKQDQAGPEDYFDEGGESKGEGAADYF